MNRNYKHQKTLSTKQTPKSNILMFYNLKQTRLKFEIFDDFISSFSTLSHFQNKVIENFPKVLILFVVKS